MTKFSSTLLCLLTFYFTINAKTIKGTVLDARTSNPLEYVNIGVLNTHFGTISNEKGEFLLDIKEHPENAKIRITMIGYEEVELKLKDFNSDIKVIKLQPKTFEIEQVVAKPNGKYSKIGVTNRSMRKLCGWGGDQRGKGHEIGLKIDLGEKLVRLESLHVRMHRQSWDTTVFRVHVRDLINNLPNEELINQNIIINVTQQKGWAKFDLSQYNIVLKGEIALSLEWLKVLGFNNKLTKVNSQGKVANVLISTQKTDGLSFVRWGIQKEWNSHSKSIPSIYLTVQE